MKKGSKAAKRWGAKMRRLRLGATTKKVRVKRKRTRGVSMARRRTTRRTSRRSGVLGGGKLMRGIFPIGGVLGLALAGVAAKTINDSVAPQVIPYQDKAAAFVVGGLPGVAGAFALDMLGKKGTTGTSVAYY